MSVSRILTRTLTGPDSNSNSNSDSNSNSRRVGALGALGARAPPTWEKSSAQKCPKEERKFRPDMSAKKKVHVPLRFDKIKTKKVGKKEENSKKKGLKLKK